MIHDPSAHAKAEVWTMGRLLLRGEAKHIAGRGVQYMGRRALEDCIGVMEPYERPNMNSKDD